MAFSWTQLSGYSFGTFQERERFEQSLPVVNDTGYTYSRISGTIPPGLRLEGNKIVGTPYEVARDTEFLFCIRASNGTSISDRSFKITISGPDAPSWVTPEGDLPVGTHQQYYTLDSSYIDFQLEATDFDIAAGQHLSYYVARNDGELPPGLVLTEDGRIVGFVQPAISIRPEDGNGNYDEGYYDAVAYDFGFRSTNGYDSYIYDNVFYDFSLGANTPKKLNRNYEFIVSVTDGDSIAKRTFRIFVVGDDYFRADNTRWLDGSGLFTADVTYLRAPIWLTKSYLGSYRANNYLTFVIDTYDTENVLYSLELVNADISAKTKQKLITDNVIGSTSLTIKEASGVPQYAQYICFSGRVAGATSLLYQVSHVTSLGNNEYRLTLTEPLEVSIPNDVDFFLGTKSVLPNGMSFDASTAEVFGRVPYQPAITTTYTFTLTATRISDKGEFASSSRIFTVDIIGEVDSVITWNTDPDLGSINANFISTLSVNATSTVTDAIVIYRVISGRLPPGLSLNLDGEIIGKVNQYEDSSTGALGLTTFDLATTSTTFDGGTTSIDRVFAFTVEARDQYLYSATTRTFYISIDTPNQIVYSNLRVKPFLKTLQRSMWHDFINDTTIFPPEAIYRPNDPSFGLQTDLSILVYAGIETKEAAAYVGAMGLNHKRKRFQFGSIKKAVAVKPGTTNTVYEVVYIEMVDPLEPNGKRLPNELNNLGQESNTISADSSKIFWSRSLSDLAVTAPTSDRPEPIISVDSTGYLASNPNPSKYFPNSISNWQDRLKSVGATERNYLPLWMRSIQPGTKVELGFKLALPLCYCKAGTADDIILNIKYSSFDFKLLDYTADRYIIDAVEGQAGDKYLVFRNDRITV